MYQRYDFPELSIFVGDSDPDEVTFTKTWRDVPEESIGAANGNYIWQGTDQQWAVSYEIDVITAADGWYLNLNTRYTSQYFIDVSEAGYAIVSDEWARGLLTGSVTSSVEDINGDGDLDTVFTNSVGGQTQLRGFDIGTAEIAVVGTYDGAILVDLMA